MRYGMVSVSRMLSWVLPHAATSKYSIGPRLNLSRGPMEYLLVAAWGKTHESILETETMPYRIHAAMLLLSANHGEGTNLVLRHHSGKVSGDEAAPGHSQFISHPSKRRLPGEKITL